MIGRFLNEAAEAFNSGDLARARILAEKVLKRAPRNPDALHLLALVHLRQDDPGSAAPLLDRALQGDPDNAELLDARSLAALLTKDHLSAESAARRLLSVRGGVAPMMRLGLALGGQQRWPEAIRCLEQAARLAPDQVDVRYNLARALREGGELERAKVELDVVLAHDPDNADALNLLGGVLHVMGQSESAVATYRRCLERSPGHAMAWQNLGQALLEQGRFGEATSCFERAVAIDPNYSKAWVNSGVVEFELGRFGRAMALYQRALAIDPSAPDAQYNHAQLLLYQRDFRSAWPWYERRVDCDGLRDTARKQPGTLQQFRQLPRWAGPLTRGQVAVWAEQGLGDQILFSTLLPDFVSGGLDFVCEVDDRLLDAYRRSVPGGRFVPIQDPPSPELLRADSHVLCCSTAGFFRLRTEDYARQPQRLLSVDPVRSAAFRDRVVQIGPAPRIALSWKSTRGDRRAAVKTARLTDLSELLTVPHVRYLDVQYGDTAAERQAWQETTGIEITRFDDVDYYNDLESLMAILEACDLVITTSNVTAHLAGAIGKRTWLIHPGAMPPFHYWTREPGDAHSLWYPSVEVISGAELPDWPSVASRVASRLRAEIGA